MLLITRLSPCDTQRRARVFVLMAWCGLCGLVLLLSACQRPATVTPLDQQVYIWQRVWTADHPWALAQSRQTFSTLRILAAQIHPKEGWIHPQINSDALKADGRPVIAVVRIDGQLPSLDQAQILGQIRQIIANWQAQGLNLVGIEIDHDCASQRLPAYAALLQQIKHTLPPNLRLSITALPAWLDSPALDQVLAVVDSSVLQVHAVQRVDRGLFDETVALRSIAAYAHRSPRDFYVALPAYHVALTRDGQVESEVRLPQAGARQEVRVDPQQVQRLLQNLAELHPPHLHGIVWFRLPMASDQRAWAWVTLEAVIRQQPLKTQLALTVQPSAQSAGLYDIVLKNDGNLDSPLPAQISMNGKDCVAGDGLYPYQRRTHDAQIRLIQPQSASAPPILINATAQRALGWVRCHSLSSQDVSYVMALPQNP